MSDWELQSFNGIKKDLLKIYWGAYWNLKEKTGEVPDLGILILSETMINQIFAHNVAQHFFK